VRIIDNPFDDIVPRITAEEKRVQQRARQAGIREREEVARRKGAKKWVYFCLTDTRRLKGPQRHQAIKFRHRRRGGRGGCLCGPEKEEHRSSRLYVTEC
jgi:hypothetical protein